VHKRYGRIGYDRIVAYSKEKLLELYQREGKSPSDLEIIAVHRALNNMRLRERAFWNKVRSHEVTMGCLTDK
jgi:hypothetical protein